MTTEELAHQRWSNYQNNLVYVFLAFLALVVELGNDKNIKIKIIIGLTILFMVTFLKIHKKLKTIEDMIQKKKKIKSV